MAEGPESETAEKVAEGDAKASRKRVLSISGGLAAFQILARTAHGAGLLSEFANPTELELWLGKLPSALMEGRAAQALVKAYYIGEDGSDAEVCAQRRRRDGVLVPDEKASASIAALIAALRETSLPCADLDAVWASAEEDVVLLLGKDWRQRLEPERAEGQTREAATLCVRDLIRGINQYLARKKAPNRFLELITDAEPAYVALTREAALSLRTRRAVRVVR